MGSARVSIAMHSESENEVLRLTEGGKKASGNVTESLVELLAVGATNVAKVLETIALDKKRSSPSSSSSLAMISEVERPTPQMPSFKNLRTLRRPAKSVEDEEPVLPYDGKTSDWFCAGIPEASVLFQNPEDSSLHVDSVTDSTASNYFVEPKYNGADLSSLRRCSSYRSHKSFLEDQPKLSKDQTRSVGGHKTPHSHKAQGNNINNNITMMNPAVHVNPYTQTFNSYATTQSMSSSGSLRRPRSRAIAIKRTRRCPEEIAASQSEESSERMYDWATWRMYNRIIDHRRNQNFGTPGPLPVSLPEVKSREETISEANLPTQLSDLTYDEEVFELEI